MRWNVESWEVIECFPVFWVDSSSRLLVGHSANRRSPLDSQDHNVQVRMNIYMWYERQNKKRKSSIIPSIHQQQRIDRSIDRRPHRDTIIITTISRQQTADSNNNNNIAVIIVTKVRAHGGFETETMDHHDKAGL